MAKEWTLMLYMAGDNDLDGPGRKKRDEIRAIGPTDAANIAIQFDGSGSSGVEREILGKPTATIKESSTGDPATLTDFVVYARDNAPSKRPILVIYNHGAGLDPDPSPHSHHAHEAAPVDTLPLRDIRAELRLASTRLGEAIFPRTVLQYVRAQVSAERIANDLTAGDFLNNKELKDAIAAAIQGEAIGDARLEIVGFEACLMNTVEVAYQLRTVARYVVGSQSVIPLAGWPYRGIIRGLHPSFDSATVAKTIVKEAANGIRPDEYTSMSALDMSKAEPLIKAISALADAMRHGLKSDSIFHGITLAHYSAQPFLESETIDLVDFCRQLTAWVKDPPIRNAAFAVENAALAFVVESQTRGVFVANAHGVSIYLPKRNHVVTTYADLDFAKKTNWVAFLEAYLVRLFGGMAAQFPATGVVPSKKEPEPKHHVGWGGGALGESAAQKLP